MSSFIICKQCNSTTLNGFCARCTSGISGKKEKDAKMKLEIFKPSDFILRNLMDVDNAKLQAAACANSKLNEWIEANCVKVWGYKTTTTHKWLFDDSICEEASTHTGLVINLEPIVKCEHTGHVIVIQKNLFKCSDCSKEIKPTSWTEA